ncbi:MAG: Na/Pi cotransporter family protein, partial [Rhizobiales bacterium]|nr:Na/Pi cotransporter family protein [Hyphomicrobiales bacterium]
RAATSDPTAPRHLDPAALATPSLALADAAREVLHMGDLVEVMLRQVMTALMTNDRTLVAQVSAMDNAVDRLDEAIKLYVARLTGNSLDEREARRAMEIVSFSINLEHVGDIIDKNLWVGFGVFMSGNVEDAHRWIREKARLRSAEVAAAERHFERLREARTETLETTSIHLDVLRDLKRIHSHICTVAYPVLEAAGEIAAADVSESDPVTLMLSNGKPAGQ